MRFSYRKFKDKFLPFVSIKIKGKEWVEFDAKIGFSRGLGIGFNILGRHDIHAEFTPR